MAGERTAELVDAAEALRRRGRLDEALGTVDRALAAQPEDRRALLVKSRLLYESGAPGRALDVARALDALLGGGALADLTAALERLDEEVRRPAPFATESMARLLEQQGYFLEAIEVYRQLYAAVRRDELRD